MAKDTGAPKRRSSRKGSAAFPQNAEPKGRTRFGPPARSAPPTKRNIFNTDPMGRGRAGRKVP